MRAFALAAILLLLLAGCGHRGAARPADWQDGVALAAVEGGKTHAADEQYVLRPPAGADLPHGCVAYQDGAEEDGDTCVVFQEGDAWAVRASWDGKWQDLQDVEAHPEQRTVVAFDAAGKVVAHWDGVARDPKAVFYTE